MNVGHSISGRLLWVSHFLELICILCQLASTLTLCLLLSDWLGDFSSTLPVCCLGHQIAFKLFLNMNQFQSK